MFDYHTDMKTIILLYENKIHFKLIGYFQNGNMISYFEHKDIPEEILKIINYIR